MSTYGNGATSEDYEKARKMIGGLGAGADTIAVALAEERKKALLDAADWLDLDADQGGPSYYVDAPAGRLAYYEPGWASEHLRHRAAGAGR